MVDKELIEIWRNMLKPSISSWLFKTNYEGMGEQDKEEFGRDFDEILDLALIGLNTSRESKWIPCSERLPKPGYCITSNEYNGVSEDFYYDGHFWNADKNAYKVIAWMPLPKPYKEGDTK